jgi:hypothetical protein
MRSPMTLALKRAAAKIDGFHAAGQMSNERTETSGKIYQSSIK